MKQLIALTLCLLASGITFAQNAPGKKKTGTKPKPKPKTEIEGYVRDGRMTPLAGVQAFVYTDSAMLGTSGYTDASGHYETGYVGKGKYHLKFVYENGKALLINGVMINKGIVAINVKLDQPAADTTLPFTDFVPKPIEKKKTKAK